MPIKLIARALTALNSNAKREQVAAGMACGVLLALVPAGNLVWLAIFALTLFVRLHYGMQMLTLAVCKLLVPLAAPALDALGWSILHVEALGGFFTALYGAPLAPLTRFNNTLVMGGLVAGLALWLPLFFAFRALIAAYRQRLAPRITGSRLYKSFMKIPLIQSVGASLSSLARMKAAME